MKAIGFALDAVIIVLSIYSFLYSPIVRKLSVSNGDVISALSSLPSSSAGTTNSSFGVSPWASHVKDSKLRASFEYIFGNDLGSEMPSSSSFAVQIEQQTLFHETGAWINSYVLPKVVRDNIPSAFACKYR